MIGIGIGKTLLKYVAWFNVFIKIIFPYNDRCLNVTFLM